MTAQGKCILSNMAVSVGGLLPVNFLTMTELGAPYFQEACTSLYDDRGKQLEMDVL